MKTVKLFYLVVLVLVLGLVLVACEADTATQVPVAEEAPAAPKVEEPTEPPQEEPTEPPMEEPSTGKYGGTLIVTYSKDLTSLDPPKAYSTMDWGTTSQLIHDGLYAYDESEVLIPELADGFPEVSGDGLVYTIHLKQGVLFHNGREMVADDVKYSIERNAKPDSGTWNATTPMSNVLGGQALIDGEAETAEGIRVIDDYTVEFTLLNPDAYFETSFTMVTNHIVPREEVERWGEDYSFHPVGTGPFMLTEWVAGERLVFEKNPNYHVEGLPYLDKIVYELGTAPEVSLLRFERGEVDVLADGIPSGEIGRIATDPVLGEQFLNTSTRLMYFFGFNNETPPFDDPRVRKAMSMVIDRDRLIQLASNTGSVAYDWYPASHFSCSADQEPMYPYDPEGAKALLAEVGYPDGLLLDVWFRSHKPWLSRIPEALQQDLAAIGVEVELLQLETAVGKKMIKDGELAMYGVTWGAVLPDPYSYATDLFTSDSTYGTQFRYSNPDVDALVAEARKNLDPDARCQQWLEVQALVMEDMPAVPLFVAGFPDMRSPRIEDFAYNDKFHRPRYKQIWIAEENRR